MPPAEVAVPPADGAGDEPEADKASAWDVKESPPLAFGFEGIESILDKIGRDLLRHEKALIEPPQWAKSLLDLAKKMGDAEEKTKEMAAKAALEAAAEVKKIKFSTPPTPQELGSYLTHLRHDFSSLSLRLERLNAKHEKEKRMKELTLSQNLDQLTKHADQIERTLKTEYCTISREDELREELTEMVQALKNGMQDKTRKIARYKVFLSFFF